MDEALGLPTSYYMTIIERILFKDEIDANLKRYKLKVCSDTEQLKEVYAFMVKAINIYWKQRDSFTTTTRLLFEEEMFMDAVLSSYLHQRVGLLYRLPDALTTSIVRAISLNSMSSLSEREVKCSIIKSTSSSSLSSLSSGSRSSNERNFDDEHTFNEDNNCDLYDWLGKV